MAIGTQYIIKLRQSNTHVVTFDSLVRRTFTHDASFIAPVTSVNFEDFYGTPVVDSFTVLTSYPFGGEPLASTTLAALISAAVAAVNAALATAGGVFATPSAGGPSY